MNIRKHWKKILLSSTAFFWASCGGDSESASVTGGDNNETPTDSIVKPDDLDGIKTDTLYGVRPVYDIDSGAVSSSDACADDCIAPASSEDAATSSVSVEEQSSSSEAESSSSYDPSMPYTLARDPSIHCAWDIVRGSYECLDGQDHQSGVKWTKEQLANNQTLTLEELDALEDENDEPFDERYAPLYGIPSTSSCTHLDLGYAVYKCSDGQTYPANFYTDEDKFLYTEEEYRAKYPEKFPSSSSTEPEPESSSSAPPPSPLCQKDDFATYSEMAEIFTKDKDALLDSVKNAVGDSLSEDKSYCLSDIEISRSYADVDVLAKKQICDGDTIVNPHYLERIEKHKDFIRKEIKSCLD